MSSVSKNYIYNTAFNILNVFIPLVTAPYLARILGSEGVGVYSYYYSIASYFALFAKLGLSNYGTRLLAAIRDDEESFVKEFSRLYIMQISVTLVVLMIYIGFVFLFADNIILAGIFGLWVFLVAFDTDWVLFALEEFKSCAVRNCIVKVITTLSIFLIVRSSDDIWKYALITSLGYGFGFIFLWTKCRKYIQFRVVAIQDVIKHIKPCFILMIPVIALSIYRTMDKVMLGTMSNMNQTGLYDYAEKLIYCLTSFISSLGTVMMPRMSHLFAKNDKNSILVYMERSMIFIVFFASGMCFGISAVADSLIPILYGEQFTESIELLRLLAVTLIFIAWGNVVRTQYAIPSKRDNVYIGSIVTGAVVNLIINTLLIPKYQAAGACVGTICAEFSVIVMQAIILKKELPYIRYIRSTMPFVIFGGLMYVLCCYIEKLLSPGLFTMILQILFGGLIYLLVSFIYLNKVLRIRFRKKA